MLGGTEHPSEGGMKPGCSHEHFQIGSSDKMLKEISENRDLLVKIPII